MVLTALRRIGGRVRRRLPGRAAVLGYHCVATPVHDPWELAVSPDHFDQQLDALARVGRVVPLDELLDAGLVERLGHVAPRFAITFDDGYADNLHAGVPLLERHGTPATVFIAPGLLDRPSYWWDVLADWALGGGCRPAAMVGAGVEVGVLGPDDADALLAADADARAVHDALYPGLQARSFDEIHALLQALAASTGVALPRPDGRPMTTGELLELAAHPLVSIGIHTVTHPRLTGLDDDVVRAEVDGGGRRLTELLGPALRLFAYPYGAASPAVAGVTASTGVPHAVTTDARWVGWREDPLFIPRLHPRDGDGPTFEHWIRHWA